MDAGHGGVLVHEGRDRAVVLVHAREAEDGVDEAVLREEAGGAVGNTAWMAMAMAIVPMNTLRTK